MEQFPLVLIAVIIVLIWLFISLNVLREYERGVIFRIGRLMGEPKGPGLIWVIWPIDRIVRVSLRTITMDVPTQDVITKDNVSVKVNAVVYFRVVAPIRAIVEERITCLRPRSSRKQGYDRCSVKSAWMTSSASAKN
jgi:regulator of protease activity HflC (stomatin/prohibitin superfamily)